ncbi:MAG TPA: STAS domain-containing protein [Nevskiaceae bacterium]|nr:STAS domain-containing protein [Nevskiaceae bacterium]
MSVTAEPVTLSLPAELGMAQLMELQDQLNQSLEAEGPVTLDAHEVARIHTAALQLFCLFCRDRRATGRATRWQDPSPALKSAAALLGMTTLLQLSREV